MRTAYISLGSNQGDRLALLREAVRLLDETDGIKVTRISPVYETDPVGYRDQPAFLNIVVEVETSLEPHALLAACQSIENKLGRVRTIRWGPRTIDLDIILIDDLEIGDDTLTIPHPRAKERAFVLVPLAEIAPSARIQGENVTNLAARVSGDPNQGVRLHARTDDWRGV